MIENISHGCDGNLLCTVVEFQTRRTTFDCAISDQLSDRSAKSASITLCGILFKSADASALHVSVLEKADGQHLPPLSQRRQLAPHYHRQQRYVANCCKIMYSFFLFNRVQTSNH